MSNSPQTKKRTDMSTPIIYNTDKWIEENKKFFNPPVCNKMMHNEGQMKMFYVGGPNQRKDYHIEEGEELFYMLKGDMCLKVVEQGKHRDVPIKEGEIFLLPACIAHSPQRQANTIGLVIERDRDPEEQDGLRYFVEKDGKPTLESLYEKWFHCEDLGSQLAPIIKGFFASEQFKTGVPLAGTIPENPPIVLDSKTKLQDPFSLANFIEDNKSTLEEKGSVNIFGSDGGSQFQVDLFAEGENTGKCDRAETLIWQIKGKSAVTVDDKEYDVVENDTMLIRQGQKYKAKRGPDSIALICFQDPKRKKK